MSLKRVNVEPGRALPCIDLADARFVTVPITLPGRAEGRLRVGATKDCILVVQAAKKVRAAYDDRYILLMSIVAAKRRLDVEPRALTSVVYLNDESEGTGELGESDHGIVPGS